MLDRWRWADWGEALRDLDRRRRRLQRTALVALVALAAAVTAWASTRVSAPVAAAVAAWATFVAWAVAVGLARALVARRRRAVLVQVRQDGGGELEALASDELASLVTVGRTASRGWLIEVEVEGDHVRVTRNPAPPSTSGDPGSAWTM